MPFRAEVESLFHELVEFDPLERHRYLAATSVPLAVRWEVEALLACDASADDGLSLVINQQVQCALDAAPESAWAESYEPYRLLRLLGSGGMGEVWLAHRPDALLRRDIALKLPNLGAHSRHFAERLGREREILAKLEHSGIARLYDAGFLHNGRPFLALEFVDGSYLSQYCNQNRLPVGARLQLFLQVLSAVEHAHSRLVIHRDLKPANILVTTGGEVKLLDFGIAKLLSGEGARETELTQLGGRALTLPFASPEQITGGVMTTASDIYSLGLVLADLLSGQPLFTPERDTVAGWEKAILQADPRRPSQTITQLQQAVDRNTTLAKLRKQLAGDLDCIVLKAIAREPARRYPTAEAFRADLERYLQSQPVLAQPERVSYRVGKWLRRHRGAALAGLAVLVALTAGLGLTLWQAGVARQEARTAMAVQQFTESIFHANSRKHPDPVKAQHTTARELLDLGAQTITSSLADAPEAKLKMLEILGSLYQDLGLEDQGVALQRQRLHLAERQYGLRSPAIVPALIDLASCLHASRSEADREALLLRGRALLDSAHDFTSETRGRLLTQLAEHYTSTDVEKATALARESIRVLRLAPPSADLSTALYTAGLPLLRAQLFTESARSLEEAIQLSKRFGGDPNPDLPRYYATAAEPQMALMNYRAAETDYRQAHQYARQLGGDDEVDTLQTESRLGTFLALTSRPALAITYLAKATADCVRVRGVDDPFYTPQMQLQYGMALASYGRPQDGLVQVSAAVANRRLHRPNTVYLAQMLEDRAAIYLDLDRLAEARADLADAEAIRVKVRMKLDDNFLTPRIRLAIRRQELKEAESLLSRYYGPAQISPAMPLNALRALSLRSELCLAKGDPNGAVALAQQLRVRIQAHHLETYLRIWLLRADVVEGSALLRVGKPNEARALLQEAVAGYTSLLDSGSPALAFAKAQLASSLRATR